MNIGGLVGALLPVFFVLALGYIAGKRNSFDPDQAAGLSKLALGFALPASLFVGMTEIPKELLLQQGRLVLALILSHDGLFLVAWLLLRRAKSLQGAAAIIYALLLATSATPVFGIAVLQPLLGDTSTGYYSSRNVKLGGGRSLCVVVFPSSAGSVRTQVRIEVPAALGSRAGHRCCAGRRSDPKSHRKLLRNDWLGHIRRRRVHRWIDSCRARVPFVESSNPSYAGSHHRANSRFIRSAPSASCTKSIRARGAGLL